MQKGTIKALFDDKNALEALEKVKGAGIPFITVTSNYTFEIISSFVNIGFMQNVGSTQAFIAAAIIERDIRAKLEAGAVAPVIDRRELSYNNFAPFERLKSIRQDVYCIDIKQAYATSLYKGGWITDETFKMMQRLVKPDRLAAVGMLAGTHSIFYHNEQAEKIDVEKDENELTCFFHNCIIDTDKKMMQIKQILGHERFIFYWVDGIYFEGEDKVKEVAEYLTSLGYKFTVDKCLNFQVTEQRRSYKVSYWMEKQEYPRCVLKRFQVGKQDMSQNRRILEILDVYAPHHSITKKYYTRNRKRLE